MNHKNKHKAIEQFFFLSEQKSYWLLEFFVWGALVSLYVLYYIFSTGEDYSWKVFIWSVLIPSQLILVSMVIRIFYAKVKYARISLGKLGLIIFIASLAGAHLWFLSDKGLDQLMTLGDTRYGVIPFTFADYGRLIFQNLLPLLGWSSLYFGVRLWKEWQRQREESSRALLNAQSAQLNILRYRMNPHFLFNSLSAIRALIDEDDDEAKRLITTLSEFLRYSLTTRNRPMVLLKEEIEALNAFFSIEKKRYEEKLDIQCSSTAEANEFSVPSFMLQPIAENAMKYGLKTSPSPLLIRFSASVENNILYLEMKNTGTLDAHELEKVNGKTESSITLLRQRFEQYYPGRYSFTIAQKDEWVVVSITIMGDE